MKRVIKVVSFSLIWLVIFAVSGQFCLGQEMPPPQEKIARGFRPGEIIVKIRDELPELTRGMTSRTLSTGSRNLDRLNRQFGVTQVDQVFRARAGRAIPQDDPLANVLLLTLQAEVDENNAVLAYASLEEVEYAELNYLYYIFDVPNDAFLSSQYGLYSPSNQGIDAIGGWDIEAGDSSVIIAIIDTGIDYDHEDLQGKVIPGYDFVNEDFEPRDDNGHGTHVAGIAAAKANNGKGIAGVCPGCSLLAIKVVTANGTGTNTWIASGISYAVRQNARVINLSLGGLDRSQTIELAVNQAYQNGAVIVAASGNDGANMTLYPAGFADVIAVGATDRYGDRANFSNYGSYLELTAPGQAIYSTLPRNRYEAWNGTSMACPHVAGLAGLVFSRNPALTNTQVRQILDATAYDLGPTGRDATFGYGRINALTALTQVPDSTGEYPGPSPSPGPYPTPSPTYPTLCGQGWEGLFIMTMIALSWVNVGHWRQRKRR